MPSPSAKNYGTKVSCLEGRKEASGQPGLVGRTTFTLRALSFPSLLLSRDFRHLCLCPPFHSAETVCTWQGRQLSVRPPLPEPSSLRRGVCRPVPGSRHPAGLPAETYHCRQAWGFHSQPGPSHEPMPVARYRDCYPQDRQTAYSHTRKRKESEISYLLHLTFCLGSNILHPIILKSMSKLSLDSPTIIFDKL